MIAPSRNGEVSFWYADIGVPQKRPRLESDVHCDICIVGAGFTGLWSAYYLKKAAPSLSVVIIEREFAGFGASGRNGGNLTGRFPWSRSQYLQVGTPDRLLAMEIALNRTVEEVLSVATAEAIDADICHSGNLSVATTNAQAARQKTTLELIKRGTPTNSKQPRALSREELLARIRVNHAISAIYNPNSARVQPAKLVRGLAAVVERLGVRIFEDTPAIRIDRTNVATAHGVVRANLVIRATEGFTADSAQFHRQLIPIKSALIVTEPLPAEVWKTIGWDGFETLSETSYLTNYCQRTRENRLTIGGRGVPYRFGSQIDSDGITESATANSLFQDLERLFPNVAKVAKIEQAWCGVLGVARDWCASVGFDAAAGQAWAGGYVGAGLAASNMAGRTLRDLILGHNTELVTFPWVNRRSRNWEFEPFRWLGIHTMYRLYGLADLHERSGRVKGSQFAKLANWVTGRSY